jgi:hypothetical protein
VSLKKHDHAHLNHNSLLANLMTQGVPKSLTRSGAAGIDVAPLMVKAGVTGQQVEDDSVWLTVQGQIRFVELVANALQDDFLGFHLAKSSDLREMGLLYYVAASSESLGEALRRLERYSTIGNEGVVLRVREGDDLAVTFRYVGVARLSDRHQIECFLTLLVRLSRQLTNRRLLPSRVSFCHRRKGGRSELDTFLGCDVVFGADTDEVAFPETVKEMPVVNADPYLNKLLIKYAEEARSHREGGGGSFQGRSGECDCSAPAARIGARSGNCPPPRHESAHACAAAYVGKVNLCRNSGQAENRPR